MHRSMSLQYEPSSERLAVPTRFLSATDTKCQQCVPMQPRGVHVTWESRGRVVQRRRANVEENFPVSAYGGSSQNTKDLTMVGDDTWGAEVIYRRETDKTDNSS
jgi:hypothetical protein